MLRSVPADLTSANDATNENLLSLAQAVTRAIAEHRSRLRAMDREYQKYLKNPLPKPDALRVRVGDHRLFHMRPIEDEYYDQVPEQIHDADQRGYGNCMGARGGVEWIVDEEAKARGMEIIQARKRWIEEEDLHLLKIGANDTEEELGKPAKAINLMLGRLFKMRATNLAELCSKATVIKRAGDSIVYRTEPLNESIIRDLLALAVEVAPGASCESPHDETFASGRTELVSVNGDEAAVPQH